jgi:PAS domain S-box-containing protein
MSLLLSNQKKEKSYKFLFEGAVSGVCLANLSGKILDCNEKFVEITGLENANIATAININNYFTDSNKKPFIFSTTKDKISQHYLYLTSEKTSSALLLVTTKTVELHKELYLLINVNDIRKNGDSKNHTQNIDSKDIEIERLKKRLYLSEEKFKKVLELSDSAVLIQNETKILFVNQAWETLTNYTKEEALEIKTWDYIHEDFKKLFQNRTLARLRGKKVPEKYDLKIITRTGKEVWVSAKITVVEFEGEQALMTSLTDITDRKRNQQALRESKKKFQSLFYENNSIMFVVDPKNGNIVDANEAACKFYRYPLSKIKTLNINDITALSEEEIQAQIDAAMEGRKDHFLFKHRLSNNEIRDVEVYSGKVEIKETILLYSVVHDITARKKAEEALKESENKLKKLNAQKDKFFSIIAHDLRGPLGSFMQLTEFIKENYGELTDAEFKTYFNHIYSSAKGTFKLLENLLVWTRSQLGILELKPKRINILEIVNETLSIYTEGIRAKEIDLHNTIGQSIYAYADENTVATVIRNLISNAIKFTPKHGDITTAAKIVELKGKKFTQVIVKDSGLGIPNDKIEKLFRIEENYSTYGTNNEKGTGLGLILCNELVMKNGGKIWVESEHGKGTTFYFNLPIGNS